MREHFYKKFLLWLGLVLLLMSLNHLTGGSLRGMIYDLWQHPGAYGQARLAGAAAYARALFNLNQILAEDKRLKSENLILLAERANADRLQRENQQLRSVLAVGAPPNHRLLLAKVFNVASTPLAAVVWLDRGAADGVRPGQAVISQSNILAGTVGTVETHSAMVWLLDDPRARISVRVGQAGVIGELRGGLAATIELVTNRERVQMDDLVITAGLDDLPDGLLVGRVTQVAVRGGNLFQSIQVRLSATPPLKPSLLIVLPQ